MFLDVLKTALVSSLPVLAAALPPTSVEERFVKALVCLGLLHAWNFQTLSNSLALQHSTHLLLVGVEGGPGL